MPYVCVEDESWRHGPNVGEGAMEDRPLRRSAVAAGSRDCGPARCCRDALWATAFVAQRGFGVHSLRLVQDVEKIQMKATSA